MSLLLLPSCLIPRIFELWYAYSQQHRNHCKTVSSLLGHLLQQGGGTGRKEERASPGFVPWFYQLRGDLHAARKARSPCCWLARSLVASPFGEALLPIQVFSALVSYMPAGGSWPASPACFSPQTEQLMTRFAVHFGARYLGTSWKAKQKVIKRVLDTRSPKIAKTRWWFLRALPVASFVRLPGPALFSRCASWVYAGNAWLCCHQAHLLHLCKQILHYIYSSPRAFKLGVFLTASNIVRCFFLLAW